jgi:hypothetical protein
MIPLMLPSVYFSKATSALLLAVSLHTVAMTTDLKRKLPKCPFNKEGEGNTINNYKEERGNNVDNNIYLKK